MTNNYSNQPCVKCHNSICKVYGGRCRKYRITNFFRKLFKGVKEV